MTFSTILLDTACFNFVLMGEGYEYQDFGELANKKPQSILPKAGKRSMELFARQSLPAVQLTKSRKTTVSCMGTAFRIWMATLGTDLHGAKRDKPSLNM
jgi:hypothetical protein